MDARRWQGWLAVPVGIFSLGVALSAGTGCSNASSTSSSSSSGTVNSCTGGAQSCRRAIDCGGGFACDVPDGGGEGCCIKVVCTADTDCTAPAKCNLRRGICAVPACDPTNPAACPNGQVCLNSTDATGAVVSICGMPPAAAKCELDVAQFSLRAGETRKLNPTYFNTAGALVAAAAGTFSSGTAATATVDPDGTVHGVASGTSVITVTPAGGTACTATVTVYGAVSGTDVRAVVFDGRSGKPVSGVKVQLRGKTGTDPAPGTTGADGVATFTAFGAASNIKDITAFDATHSWVTYVDPGSNDVVFYVDPLPDATKIAGVSGTFDTTRAQPPTGDIKLGLAAFSIAGALSDLNLGGLIGRTVPTDINIPSININQADVPLPSGVYLKLQNSDIKGNVDMYAEGPCATDAPCTRVLWGLGGQVALSKIGPIISNIAGGGGDIDAGAILSAVLPFFRKFYHAVKGGYSLTDKAAPALETDPPGFTQSAEIIRPNYLLSNDVKVTVPTLPSLPTDSTKFISGALVLTGSLVPGKGFVPLGLSAGLDECPAMSTTSTCRVSGTADGKLSCSDDSATPTVDECTGLEAGQLTVDYAPQHDGLEGLKYATVAVALDVNSLGAGSLFTSVLVSFDQTLSGAGGLSFPAGAFLGFNKGSFAAPTRTYSGTTRVTGAAFYRLNLDTAGKPWLVYFNAASDTFSVEVPPLPAGTTGDRITNLDVQAFKLFTGTGQPADLVGLESFNSTNFDNLVNYTAGFSTQACTVIYPARECTENTVCQNGFSKDYTCDTTAGVCVSTKQNVSAKGAAACATGTRELSVGATKKVCSQIPACEMTTP